MKNFIRYLYKQKQTKFYSYLYYNFKNGYKYEIIDFEKQTFELSMIEFDFKNPYLSKFKPKNVASKILITKKNKISIKTKSNTK